MKSIWSIPAFRLKAINEARRVLLVTSHPDDETMFFGPTLLNMCRTSAQAENVFLLCMSKGGYSPGGVQGASSSSQSGGSGKNNSSEELGNTRKKELYEACRVRSLLDSIKGFEILGMLSNFRGSC